MLALTFTTSPRMRFFLGSVETPRLPSICMVKGILCSHASGVHVDVPSSLAWRTNGKDDERQTLPGQPQLPHWRQTIGIEYKGVLSNGV